MKINVYHKVVKDYRFGEPCCDVMRKMIDIGEVIIMVTGDLIYNMAVVKYCFNCGKPVEFNEVEGHGKTL